MIEIENQVYSRLKDYLTSKFADINMSSVYINAPSQFPFVSIVEIDNSVNTRAEDCCNVENADNISYEINIQTKNPNTKKIVANDIARAVDEFMLSLGFIRNSKVPLSSDNDGVAYRIVMRYSGVVDKNFIVYRR